MPKAKTRYVYRIEWLTDTGVGGRGVGAAKVEATSADQARDMVSKAHGVPKSKLVIRSRTPLPGQFGISGPPVHFTRRRRR